MGHKNTKAGVKDFDDLKVQRNPRRLPKRSGNGPEEGNKMRKIIQQKKQHINTPRGVQGMLLTGQEAMTTEVIRQNKGHAGHM